MRGVKVVEPGLDRVPWPLKTRNEKFFIYNSNISAYNIINRHKY